MEWKHQINNTHLDQPQAEAVRKALTQDITFLWGPPGTGKTHTLGSLIASASLGGLKVLATAISNVAVDQLALSTVRALELNGKSGSSLLDSGKVLRFGYARLPEITEESRLFPDRIAVQKIRKELHETKLKHRSVPETDPETRAILQKRINDLSRELRDLTRSVILESKIVLTTVTQTALEEAFTFTPFDLVVVDEASMMSIPYLASLGHFGAQRLVIGGDFRQLNPIAISRSERSLRWLHQDIFSFSGIADDASHPALNMLTNQRRMHPEICKLINQPFYQGKLQSSPNESKKAAVQLEPISGCPAVYVHLDEGDGSLVERTESGSRLNRASAHFVVSLAAYYLSKNQSLNVGILAPYRSQVNEIKRLLKERIRNKIDIARVTVGTVHAFQGSENDVVIWDLVETTACPIGRLYKNEIGDRLANVALSRAKRKLILVGNADAFFQAKGNESVKKLKKIFADHFHKNGPNCESAKSLKRNLYL